MPESPLSFFSALLLSSEVVGKLLLVAGAGFFFARRRLISEEGVRGLSRILIDFIVPCALSMSMVKGWNAEGLAMMSPLLLLPPLWVGATALITLTFFRLFPANTLVADRVSASVASIPNSFYIPFPIIYALTDPADHVMGAMLVGAAVLAINPLQWTLGVWLVMGGEAEKRHWRESLLHILNGPVIGVIAGVILAQFPVVVSAAKEEPGSPIVLRTLFSAMTLAGQAMGPMAMILIGALMGSTPVRKVVSLRGLLPVLLFRFLIVPGITWLLITSGQIPGGKLVWLVLLVEASAPPAMNLAVAARRYDGDWETTSGLLLVSNLFALITLPLWIAVALRL